MAADPRTEPTGLELSDTKRRFIVTWADGHVTEVAYRTLRLACRCAGCVDEVSGVAILDPATVRADIGIDACEEVGLYGVRIRWTDGHGTGIYTWARIRELG